MIRRIRARLAGIAPRFLVAAAIIVAPSAQAAVYSGAWDPSFGAAFPSLGWRATATLFVPDACTSAVNTQQLNNQTNNPPTSRRFDRLSDCANIAIIDPTVYFYDIVDPTRTTVESFSLGGYLTTTNATRHGASEDRSILSIDFVDGIPVSLETSASLRFSPSAATRSLLLGGVDAEFALTLSLDPRRVRLFYMTGGQTVADAAAAGQYGSHPPTITFNGRTIAMPVATPATLPLVLAALALAGFVRRRRRA